MLLFGLVTVGLRPSKAEVVTVMPIGDSITAGMNGPPSELRGSYRYELSQMLQHVGIEVDFVGDYQRGPGDNEHQGVSGASIGYMVQNYGSAIANHQPDYALVLAGTNNHWQGPDEAFFVQQYSELLTTIRDQSPETSIIVATVPKFGYDRVPETSYWTEEFVDLRNEQTFPTMNRAIRQVADDLGEIAVVDYYAVLDPETDLVSDAVHPNLYGHRKLATQFFEPLSSQIRAVPEPGAAGLLGLGSAAWVFRRHRRRSVRAGVG